jgi:hypothetical protein
MGFEQIDSKLLERIAVALETIATLQDQNNKDAWIRFGSVSQSLTQIEHSIDDISNAIIASA